MIDERLPTQGKLAYRPPGFRVESRSLRTHFPVCPRFSHRDGATTPMSSLLDQSAIADFAQRLVPAARRAGADQADALAVRSISLSVDVRDDAVEESQRS